MEEIRGLKGGHYTLLDSLGKGSQAEIYKVQRREDSQFFACKVYDFAHMSNIEKTQVVNEVNFIRDLRHPNILSYIDRFVDKASGKLYVFLEYCETSLEKEIKEHKNKGTIFSTTEIINILYELLDALCYLHSNGIMHKDIKPGNVLKCKDTYKLADFGFAEQATSSSIYYGTPLYMAPEILRYESYNMSVDTWSLGCLLYEMCQLKSLFEEAYDEHELIELQAKQEPIIISEEYLPLLAEIIKLMLSFNPEKRPTPCQLLSFLSFDSELGFTGLLLN